MIIAVTDRKISAKRDLFEQLEAIADSSPDMIILREKDVSEAEYRYLAIECMRLCSYRGVRFCTNSFINVAAALDTGRIQVSFDSLISNNDKLRVFEEIWVSVHSLKEAVEAEKKGATHLIYGNVFETSCKPGARGKGIDELKKVCAGVTIPIYAIGGIDLHNAGKVIQAGCEGVCVRSLLMRAEEPHRVVEGLRTECRLAAEGRKVK